MGVPSFIDILVKNYRCFEDRDPLKLRIYPGRFTALVGANNAGKSAALRLLYELRPILQFFVPRHTELILGVNLGQAPALGVDEPGEILCDRNERPLMVEFAVGDTPLVMNLTVRRDGWWQFGVTVDETRLLHEKAGRLTGTVLAYQGRHIDLLPAFDAMQLLSEALYIGPFRNALNSGDGSHYDIQAGTAFAEAWSKWKTGDTKRAAAKAERVRADIERIFRLQNLEINVSPDRKTIKLVVDGRPYRLSEMGAGLAQFIVVLANCAMKEPSLILIDEPELNLHPALQGEFLRALAGYSKHGGVVYATHSYGLSRSLADPIYAFHRSDGRTTCRPLSALRNYSEFVGELQFSAFQELGFEGIVLVEGVTDVRLVQQFLRMFRCDHRYVLIPLGGSALAGGDREHELKELLRISPNVHAIVDSEREGADLAPQTARREFAATCVKVGINVLVTKRRALDNYLTKSAIQAVLGPKYSDLGGFGRLKGNPIGWDKNDNWKIAQHMTREDLEDTDVGEFFSALARTTVAAEKVAKSAQRKTQRSAAKARQPR